MKMGFLTLQLGLTIKALLMLQYNMSPWDMVAALGIYTDEQIDEMTWAECEEILSQEE